MDTTTEGKVSALRDFLTTGGGTIALLGFIKYLITRRDALRSEDTAMLRELTRRSAVLSAIRKMVRDSGALRAMVCVARNGGKQPNPSCRLTSTVCQDECEFMSHDDPSQIWKEQPLTEWYMNVLVSVSKEKQFTATINDVPPDEPLRNLFEVAGVKKARAYEICSRDGEYYYLAIHFQAKDKLNAKQEEAVRVGVSTIREAYRHCFKTKSIFRQ